jgi:Glucodextranase, domain B
MESISKIERGLSAAKPRFRRSADGQRLCAAASVPVRVVLIALFLALIPSPGRAATFVAFGPQQYIRADGQPTPVINTFSVLDPTTTFTMRIDNSGVSSASVMLNGVEVFKESDFNASVTLLTKPVTLQATNQLRVELRGNPGEGFRLQIIGDDNAPPTITAAVTPAPNVAGWNKSNPTVTFACADSTSGIASCAGPVVVTTETAGQIVAGTAVDKAGNTASASVIVKLDKTPPSLNIASPANGSRVFASHVTVGGVAADTLSGLASVTCNGAPAALNGANFSCGLTLTPGANSINVNATDIAGNTSTSPLTLTFAPAPAVRFTSPANLSFLNLSPTTVTGTVDDPTATITVNSIQAPVANGHFSVTLPLAEGPNIITATATFADGAVGTTSIEVTLDTTPPHVTVTSPPNTFVTTDETISVAGNVNDLVVGTVNEQQAQVTVNGAPAQVANRLFLATNVALALGSNIIQVVGRDRVGNAATTQITVTRQAPSPLQIRLVSGNNQTGTLSSVLPAPLVVALTDSNGNPVPNKAVIFKVTQNDGMVSSGAPPAPTVIAMTNAQGQAQVQWKLGNRAGAGGNSVEAYAVGFGGTAIFTASGTQGPAGKIVVDTGNNQISEINQSLPRPLIAVVVDNGNNRLAGTPVTFTIQGGGGRFGGQSSSTVTTDSDGRAAATLTLGSQEGNANNIVEANFPANTNSPAVFVASARVPGDASRTTISGIVLDNTDVPIAGVTIRAVLTNLLNSNSNIVQTVAAVQTDAQGQFTITQAPVGFVKLLVDGSTAQRPGKYPTLDYDMVTVSGQKNTLGLPIYLLALNTGNQLCVTATTGGGTLTVPEAPGFSLTFAPGQVTFPGGSKEGCINVTVVHGDKVPMAPGFGQQPRFIVPIQPAGAVFNPPAAITLPNVDGLKPREVTEMYSFDHDIGSFVAIGTGVVSDDGQVIRSSPGVGVLKAGWHCGGNPAQTGKCDDDPCKKAAQDARDLANNSQGTFDNTSIFANIQACIAEQACQNKQNLENPDWLDKVVPDFINKWKDETGAWIAVKAVCQSFTLDPKTFLIRKQLCAATMAAYHINADLKGTLVNFGCGTDSDFGKIGDIIRNCTSQNLGFPFNEIAKPIVDFMRDFVHDQCINERGRRGLPPN